MTERFGPDLERIYIFPNIGPNKFLSFHYRSPTLISNVSCFMKLAFILGFYSEKKPKLAEGKPLVHGIHNHILNETTATHL
jgi:hypothetical protein